ncbi:MAG: hypothetical protein ACXWZF_13510 [Actinomycetota bacterium]
MQVPADISEPARPLQTMQIYIVESKAYMDALASGRLVLRDGCLFLDHGSGPSASVDTSGRRRLELSSDGLLMREGDSIARVGDEIELGGGIVKGSSVAEQVVPLLPDDCVTSRVWPVSPEVRPPVG